MRTKRSTRWLVAVLIVVVLIQGYRATIATRTGDVVAMSAVQQPESTPVLAPTVEVGDDFRLFEMDEVFVTDGDLHFGVLTTWVPDPEGCTLGEVCVWERDVFSVEVRDGQYVLETVLYDTFYRAGSLTADAGETYTVVMVPHPELSGARRTASELTVEVTVERDGVRLRFRAGLCEWSEG